MRHASIALLAFSLPLVAAPAAGQQHKLHIADMSATLSSPLRPEIFRWQAGQPPVQLPPVSTHMCVLGRVSGKFEGYGERVRLTVDNGATGGPRWQLDGSTQQSQMQAEAICVLKSKFAVLLGKAITGKSETTINHNVCARRDVWFNPASPRAYFIGGVAGKLAGAGEKIHIGDGGGASVVGVEACSGAVEAHIVSVGVEGGGPVKYRTYTGRITDGRRATYRDTDSAEKGSALSFLGIGGEPFQYNGPDVFLTPVEDALCGLTAIEGRFQGYGEQVSIKRATGTDGRPWWTLSVSTQSAGSSLAAEARCISRDQR